MINMSRFGRGFRREDIVHSNAMAKVANGSNLGSTSSESFQTRKVVEQNRSNVGSYKAAMIHSDYKTTAIRPFKTGTRPDISSPKTNSASTPKTKFSEPGSRGFNPYR